MSLEFVDATEEEEILEEAEDQPTLLPRDWLNSSNTLEEDLNRSVTKDQIARMNPVWRDQTPLGPIEPDDDLQMMRNDTSVGPKDHQPWVWILLTLGIMLGLLLGMIVCVTITATKVHSHEAVIRELTTAVVNMQDQREDPEWEIRASALNDTLINETSVNNEENELAEILPEHSNTSHRETAL